MHRKKPKNIFSKTAAVVFIAALFVPVFVFGAVPNNPDLPEMITRSEWGADESKITVPKDYARVEKFIIHHTASSELVPDSDGSGEYKDMIKTLQNITEITNYILHYIINTLKYLFIIQIGAAYEKYNFNYTNHIFIVDGSAYLCKGIY